MNASRKTLVIGALCLLGVVGVMTVMGGAAETATSDDQLATVATDGSGDSTGYVGSVAGESLAVESSTPTAADDVPAVVNHIQTVDPVEACAVTPPSDHGDPDGDTEDVIGWVDGYWYDEPLDIEGPELAEDELESLVARTSARVEALRCLAFEETPPLELLTREEYRESLETDFDSISEAEWQFEDARHASMLIAGQAVDAEELQIEFQAGFPAAFYNTEDEFMGFITDDPDAIEIDQVTLAHELTHALQDQHFSIEEIFDEPTNDAFVASLAVVEGDATVLDERYEENCAAETWADACIRPPVEDADVVNFGLTLNLLAAYHTPLVAETLEAEGFDGVNALLEAYPESTVEAIYPERYGEFEVADLTVEDRSDDAWERIVIEDDDGEPTEAYDVVGQHGLTAMLVAPSFETDGVAEIIDITAFQRPHAGGFLTYDVTETSGWTGDRLYGYTNDDGDNASVWKLAWEAEEDTEQFAAAYEDLVAHRGGTLVEGYENVYTFEGEDEYDMAVGIERDGDRLWIATAPTVDDLTAVHGDLDLREATADPDDDDDMDDENGETDGDDDAIPGFGVAVALGALAVALAAWNCRPKRHR